ncbi:MAG: hypothetical protein M3N31_09110 [Actinomycetota bacterium]|nr:hypothetical protein [Actinomycetota bacterium]
MGAKGGVGTTTVAALHALAVARTGRQTRLSARQHPGDLAAVFGLPAGGSGQDAMWRPT